MRKVLELPAFRRLLAVSMVNELALAIGSVALAFFVYRRTGSALGATAFFLCAEFGPALLTPFIVTRLDARPARWALVSIYLSQVVIFAALSWIVDHFALSALLAFALLSGSVALAGRVLVRAGWTAATAPAGLVREANAVMNFGSWVWLMVGPIVGGGIVAAGGTRAALIVDVALFSLGTLLAGTARSLQTPVSEASPGAHRLREAFAYVRGQAPIRRLLTLQAAAWLCFSLPIPVEVILAQHTLHAGADGYGALLAAWGGGAVAGSAIYARWRARPSRILITLGTCFFGAGFLIMATGPDLAVAVAGAAIAGVGNGTQLVAMKTALQEAVAERWMAPVLSLNESMLQAVPGVGILLGGAIAAVWGPRIALAVAAAASFAIALLMWWKLDAAKPEDDGGSVMPEPIGVDAELAPVVRDR